LPRVSPVNVPQHIVQRGNNRQACFASEQDFARYVNCLKEYPKKYFVDIHAWVLMTHHVHLLCIPRMSNSISLMMQSLGRQYVRYFNGCYGRSGTLWEGRYKSCLVQAEVYLLHLYRYIELNPVRANMIEDPAEYHWPSYQINGLGKESELCTPHPIYLARHSNAIQRQAAYRSLFSSHIEGQLLEAIRVNANKGMAFGNESFKQEKEALTGRIMKDKKRLGQPAHPQKKEKQTGGVGIKLTLPPVLTPRFTAAFLQRLALPLGQLSFSLAVICWVRFSTHHYKHSDLPLLVC
jgi:putative transposase